MSQQEAIREAQTEETKRLVDPTHFGFVIGSSIIKENDPNSLNSLFVNILDASRSLGAKTVTLNLPELPDSMPLRVRLESDTVIKQPTVVVRFGYSARAELVRTTKKIVASGINPEEIDEQTLSANLDMPDLTSPYGIIFIGPEYAESIRFNNELNWRMTYAEFATIPYAFDEITKEDIKDKIRRCLERQQNFGGRAVV